MKNKDFARLVDTIFAVKAEEMECSDYFDELPRYVDLEVAGEDAGSLLPEVKHHMHQCPECEEVYQALLKLVKENFSSSAK